MQPQR
jgi:centrosomal protein CEP104